MRTSQIVRTVSVRSGRGSAVAGVLAVTSIAAFAGAAPVTLPNTQNPSVASSFVLDFGAYGGVASARITETDFALEIDPATGTARFAHYVQHVEPITMPDGSSTGNLTIAIEQPSVGAFDRQTGDFRIDGDEYVIYFDGDLSSFGITSPFRLPSTSCGSISFATATAGATGMDWVGHGFLPNPFDPLDFIPFSYTCSVNGAFTLQAATTYIAGSNPFGNAVDAGRPHLPQDDTSWEGWTQVELTLNAHPNAAITPDSIEVSELGGDGAAPVVLDVQSLGDAVVLVTLSEPIEPGAWTTLTHKDSGTGICLASLPGDVNSDRLTGTADVEALAAGLDALNETLLPWQCDVDRSGSCTASDLLAAVDLLNGAATFRVWDQQGLPPSPCGDAVTASCGVN